MWLLTAPFDIDEPKIGTLSALVFWFLYPQISSCSFAETVVLKDGQKYALGRTNCSLIIKDPKVSKSVGEFIVTPPSSEPVSNTRNISDLEVIPPGVSPVASVLS
jgi:hypothetical protein